MTHFIELLMEVPILEEVDDTPTLVATSMELMYVKIIGESDAFEEVQETTVATATQRPGTIAAYAIKGHDANLPIRAIKTFDTIEDFLKNIKPNKNGERTQLAVEDSVKIITARFIAGEWTWTGV